jgi:hypothetical protein
VQILDTVIEVATLLALDVRQHLTLAAHRAGEASTEFAVLSANGFIRYNDAEFGQQ